MEAQIMEVVDRLQTATDEQIRSAVDKLDRLRQRIAGVDRETVIWAIQECRELLSPAGRLRRALALAVKQNDQADTRVA